MPDNFARGEAESMNTAGPVIAQPEPMGARYGITVANPGPPSPDPLVEPYLMPPYHGRHGSNERVDPAIVHTPLGAMMPGPNAIAPAVPVADDYRHPTVDAAHGWYAGVNDSYGEGCPIPLR